MEEESFSENDKQEKPDNIENFVKANLHYLPEEKQKEFYNIIDNNKISIQELAKYPTGILKAAYGILKAQKE